MKKVLLVQPNLQPPGGGNGVAAWIIEALKTDYAVTALTFSPVHLPTINRFYGTSLTAGRLDHRARLSDALGHLPPATPAARPVALQSALSCLPAAPARVRRSDQHQQRSRLRRKGIQYIHFPSAYQPRPMVDLRWYHLPILVRLYRATCEKLGRFDFERMKQNVTLTNSDWTGGKVRERHAIGSRTFYPPVRGRVRRRPLEGTRERLCLYRSDQPGEGDRTGGRHPVQSPIARTRRPPSHRRHRGRCRVLPPHRALAERNGAWVFLEEEVGRVVRTSPPW